MVLNLALNARDAMPDGGRLRMEVRNEPSGPGGPGAWAVLAVSDTGTGMAPEVRDRLFEPFFTTKAAHGTGLGLATVLGIVEGAGGRVEVESAPGRGTRFEVWLPALPAAPAPVESAA